MGTKVRWPFLVLLGLAGAACATFIVLAWFLPEPPPDAPAETVTARAHDTKRAAPPATCATEAGVEPVRGATGKTEEGRAFHVWGPAAPTTPVPIALVLHGAQSNGVGFQFWFHFDRQTADQAYAVYPDSAGPSWDVTGDTDLTYLEHVLDEMTRTYCVDRSRVLVFGFSFGARMAHHVGCKRPDLATAIVAGGGDWVDAEPECGGPLPVLLVHRTRDPIEHVEWARSASQRWANVQHCATKETSSKLDAECTEFLGCGAPGSVTFCEDPWFDPEWPVSWNHTVREPQKTLAWRWFTGLTPSRTNAPAAP